MTVKEYEKLYDEMMEIADELERCRACIQDVEWEFNGEHPNYAAREGCMGLHHMYGVLRQKESYGFWQGQSADAFEHKLRELYNEFVGAKDDILAGLHTIEKQLEKKFEKKRDQVSAAEKALSDAQKVGKVVKDDAVDLFEWIWGGK
ncbi:MAG: hypothetical protein IJO55_12310 [Lachnospiraceae bacterium]|nr:hypothetical protein [Lachnospiraceae bacterium]